MKKSLVIFVSALAIIGLLAGCASSGGGTAGEPSEGGGIILSNPVLFENGEWNPELGEVTAELIDGDSGTFENGVYFSDGGAMWRFFFENPVDARASGFGRIVIEVEETESQMGWWAGGQLISFYPEAFEHEGEMTNLVWFGLWDGNVHASRRVNLSFRNITKNDLNTRHRFDASNVAGFAAKATENGGKLTIVRAYFE